MLLLYPVNTTHTSFDLKYWHLYFTEWSYHPYSSCTKTASSAILKSCSFGKSSLGPCSKVPRGEFFVTFLTFYLQGILTLTCYSVLTQPHLGDFVFPFPLKKKLRKICIEIDPCPGSPRGNTKIRKPLDFGFPILVRKMLPFKTFDIEEEKTGLDEN